MPEQTPEKPSKPNPIISVVIQHNVINGATQVGSPNNIEDPLFILNVLISAFSVLVAQAAKDREKRISVHSTLPDELKKGPNEKP